MIKIALAFALAGVLALVGCGGGSSEPAPTDATETTSQQDALYSEACKELLQERIA